MVMLLNVETGPISEEVGIEVSHSASFLFEEVLPIATRKFDVPKISPPPGCCSYYTGNAVSVYVGDFRGGEGCLGRMHVDISGVSTTGKQDQRKKILLVLAGR